MPSLWVFVLFAAFGFAAGFMLGYGVGLMAERIFHRRRRARKIVFALEMPEGYRVKGEKMALTLTTVQQVSLSVTGVDAKGNPAPLENIIYSSSDEAVLTVEQDASDESKALAKSVGVVGTAQVRVGADAKIGEGVSALVGLLDIEVAAAEAVSLGITAGTPEDQPTTPTAQASKKSPR